MKNENMKQAVMFEAVSFEVDVKDKNGEIKKEDFSASLFTGEVPRSLTEEEAKTLYEKSMESFYAGNCLPEVQTSTMVPVRHETCIPLETGGLFAPKGIYAGLPQNVSRFREMKETKRETISAVSLFNAIKAKLKIRVYQEDFYLFDELEGKYKKLSENNLHRLINYYFGKQIEEEDALWVYSAVSDYIRKDYSLCITEELLLPARYWAFHNGFLDLKSKDLIPNSGQYFVRSVLQAPYDPYAECPRFEAFLESIAAGDESLHRLLWEVVGYLLANDTNAKCFFVCVGPKDTGKSLFARVITGILGEDAVGHLSASDFGNRFDVSELNGKKLNVCMDLPDRALNVEAVGKIKALTGNDFIRSDVKYKEAITFRPTSRLLFGANSKVRTEVSDPAFFKRLVMLPFLNVVPKECQEHDLEAKLLQEAPGICRKALNYYCQLVLNDYQFTTVDWCDDSESSVDYRQVIKAFSQEVCEFTGSENDRISSSELAAAFDRFCAENAVMSLEANDFSKKFKELNENSVIKKKAKINGRSLQCFFGVKLKDR